MKLMVFAGAFLMAVSALGQGTVLFNNRVLPSVNSRVTLLYAGGGTTDIRDGVPDPDTKWEAQLFGGPEGGTLAALTPKATFRTGAGAGYIFGEEVPIPGVAPGERASLQMKAFQPKDFIPVLPKCSR
jgi:hypothetical protein